MPRNWDTKPLFGFDAPSKQLGFPRLNVTAAELMAFCPYWHKSDDVVCRLYNNGLEHVTAARMFKKYRILPPRNTTDFRNSINVFLRDTMRRSPLGGRWTVNTHWQLMRTVNNTTPQSWREAGLGNLWVGDFKTEAQRYPNRHQIVSLRSPSAHGTPTAMETGIDLRLIGC
jgi:hypothetical protein